MTSLASRQCVLPIFDVFVFFDWYNTLSTARFWDSILASSRHPLSTALDAALDDLFRGRKEFVGAWMRGLVTDEEVITTLNVALPRRYCADYLLRGLLRDCRNATVDPDMADIVCGLRDRAFLAVASDNMACFVRAAPRVLTAELRIDELIVSCCVGSLKKESPDRFFGPTLALYGLEPANAILIDDCADTCEVFREWGGVAFHFTEPAKLRTDIEHLFPALAPV